MYKVFFSKKSIGELKQYFKYVRKYFDNLYFDTGIIDLFLIKKNYNTSIKNNYDCIEKGIISIAEIGLLGYKPKGFFEDYELCENMINIKNYKVIIISKKYIKEKIITIESITISQGK